MSTTTTIYRLSVLVSEGRTSVAEIESYSANKELFAAWLSQKWAMRHKAMNEADAALIATQQKAWEASRPAVVAALKGSGKTFAERVAAVTPEQEQAAWDAIGGRISVSIKRPGQ
jgi:hypothetical protein